MTPTGAFYRLDGGYTIMSSDVNTPWIDAEGARSIARDAGIFPDEHPYFAQLIAERDRPTYVQEVLFELAWAVARKSTNPTLTTGQGTEQSPKPALVEPHLRDWARRCAAELDQLLVDAEEAL